jgi:hypothetical protein
LRQLIENLACIGFAIILIHSKYDQFKFCYVFSFDKLLHAITHQELLSAFTAECTLKLIKFEQFNYRTHSDVRI